MAKVENDILHSDYVPKGQRICEGLKGIETPESGIFPNSLGSSRSPTTISQQSPTMGSLNEGTGCAAIPTNDQIVISGMSGRLPQSNNMEEFLEHLWNGDDMITEDNSRWEPGYYDLPKRHGKIRNLEKFDAAAFGVHPKQASNMDPQLRILLEVAYEAMLDAGCSPQSLRGTNTGVFVGASESETASSLTSDPETVGGYSLTGCTRSMFANRLSYTFDLRGPSFAVDTACSSSLQAMALAVDAIRLGHCDAAIVAGCHITLAPTSALQFKRLGMLSDYGACKTFDADGTGYVRAEGIGAILIQKSTSANRIYAEVVHARANTDGYKDQGITFPSGDRQKELLETIYSEANVNPKEVSYIETHGTGTKVGDPQEAHAIAEVFCGKDRVEPLLIGSVKSNMGHTEPASGIASIAKVLLCMEKGMLLPNLHYQNPNPNIDALLNGQMKVVTERTLWDGGYVGINSFGFGGSNVHVILKSNAARRRTLESGDQPLHGQLVYAAGRSKEAVEQLLSDAAMRQSERSFIAMLNEIANQSVSVCPYRGFTILNGSTDDPPKITVQKVPPVEKRPVWFIYSGMGTQYVDMGADLMKLKVFRNTIERCDNVLKEYDINIMEMLETRSPDLIKSTTMCFVSIASIQVALTELLRSIGITPDGMTGHSVGELGCSFADGCLTVEETILCSYWRGRCVEEATIPLGKMAAVGLSWKEAHEQCPQGVTPACHNSEDSVTVSGEAAAVTKFVEELQSRDVFAKEVKSSGVAFHSPYMKTLANKLRTKLQEVITKPRRRSSRWISSSIPEQMWNGDIANYCSADYHVNNLTSPVLFNEALKHVPDNAVAIEIAPHCLLQAILKRSLPNCTNIGLVHVKSEDKAQNVLNSLGLIYGAGIEVNVNKLNDTIRFPVPRGTPMIGPLMEWDHSVDWPVMKGSTNNSSGGRPLSCSFTIDPFAPDSEDKYVLDHQIDGRVLFPFTGFIVLVWKTICKINAMNYLKTPFRIDEMIVHKATMIHKKPVKFDVSVPLGEGYFEVLDEDGLTASGTISILKEKTDAKFLYDFAYKKAPLGDECKKCCSEIHLNSKDVYREYALRGYEYGPEFRGVEYACNCGSQTELKWDGNYVSFIDTLLQTSLLQSEDPNSLLLPIRLRYFRLDPERHLKWVMQRENGASYVPARTVYSSRGYIGGGVEAAELVTQPGNRRLAVRPPVLERVIFIPLHDSNCFADVPDVKQHLSRYLQVCQTALSGSNKTPDFAFEFDDCDHAILSILRDRDGSMKMTIKEFLNDCLWRGSWHSRSLKALSDLALENIPGHKLKCAALDPFTYGMPALVKDHLEANPLVETKWSVIVDLTDCQSAAAQRHFAPEDLRGDDFPITSVRKSNGILEVPADLNGFELLVADRVVSSHSDPVEYLTQMWSMLKPGSFCLINEQTSQFQIGARLSTLFNLPHSDRSVDDWMVLFEKVGFTVVGSQSDPSIMTCLFLLRKSTFTGSVDSVPSFVDVDDVTNFDFLVPLQKEIEDSKQVDNSRVWVKSNLVDSGVTGLVQCIKEEHQKIQPLRSILEHNLMSKPQLAGERLKAEFAKIQKSDLILNLYRDGEWGSLRHINMPLEACHPDIKDDGTVTKVLYYAQYTVEVPMKHAFLTAVVRGDLGSLAWVESENQYFDVSRASGSKFLCTVDFSALNFRDVMLATGRLSPAAIPGNWSDQDCPLGMEFSGYNISTGERVMGILPAKALATSVTADPNFTWTVPENWSQKEAATVPAVYTTAYYSLFIRGKLRKGESILVHGGSGGVGQASITLALAHGATVYTTVGTEEKRQFLRKKFPQLVGKCIIGSTRTVDFEQEIMEETDGRGVDVILNSLSDDKLQASVRCLAMHGRFLEIGKFDLSQNTALGMSVFLKNVSFNGILLDSLYEPGNLEWEEVNRLFTEGLKNGVVQPLDSTVFESNQAEEAFRYMAQGKHKGKVLIRVRTEEQSAKTTEIPTVIANRQTFCNPTHVYLLTGGLGGVGLELAQWLARRGATKLVLTSRSGIRNGFQARVINRLRKRGLTVETSKLDISNREQAEELFKLCLQMGPIGGIFHLAMVIRDMMFEDQTADAFQATSQPKLHGTRHLDELSRKMCDENLKWFIVFSSTACGRGNKGQSAYGWANSVMERIVEQRKADGYPGMAIQWGAIGDVGVVLETFGSNDANVGGTLPQRINSILQVFDYFLCWKYAIVSSYIKAPTGDSASLSGKRVDVLDTIAHILGVSDIQLLDLDTPLGDLGLDSLMGVEIRQALERDFDFVLSMKEIRTLTLSKLKEAVESGDAKSKDDIKTGDQLEGQALLRHFGLRVDPNKLRPKPSECFVPLNSITEGDPVIFVHSIEGIAATIEDLAIQIMAPTYCLQMTPDVPTENMQSIAQYYVKKMKKVFRQGPYTLVGYSFGGVVAIEMAKYMQGEIKTITSENNPVKNLVLLDSSHLFMEGYRKMFRAAYKINASLADNPVFDAETLCAFAMRFVQIDYSNLRKTLLSLPNWTERLKHTVAVCMSEGTCFSSAEIPEFGCSTLRRKLLCADRYNPSGDEIVANTVLIRAEKGAMNVEEYGSDLGLSKVINGNLQTMVLEGDHDSFIHDESGQNASRIINDLL